jgi:CHAD domain-containing protein
MFDCQGASGVADERIFDWASMLVRADVRAFRRARKQFLSHPSKKRLHEVRTAARRLRSNCEDVREIVHFPHEKQLRRLIALMGEARDATVLRKTFCAALDAREHQTAESFLSDLRRRERKGYARVECALERIDF